MKTSIIMVNYNCRPFLEDCLGSLLNNTDSPFEILVIDNNSRDDSKAFLQKIKDPKIRLILNKSNMGFAAACNQGLKKATGEILVTMNPDVLVPKGWLSRMSFHLKKNPKTLTVGPKSLGIGGRQWAGPLSFSQNLDAADRKFASLYRGESEPAKFLIGCLLLFDRRLMDLIGYFDEKLALGADDYDLSLRIRRAGYELRIAKDVLISHVIHASFNRSNQEECRRLALASWNHFREKWAAELKELGWIRLFADEFPVFPGEPFYPPLPLIAGGNNHENK